MYGVGMEYEYVRRSCRLCEPTLGRNGLRLRQGWSSLWLARANNFFLKFYSLSDLIGYGAAGLPRRHMSANHGATLHFVRGEAAVSAWCK